MLERKERRVVCVENVACVARCVECDRTMSLVVESVASGKKREVPGTTPRGATQSRVDVALLSRAVAVTSACARSPTFHGMPTRGVTFARYLRKVHIEWCPFKPKAVGPIFFGRDSCEADILTRCQSSR